MKRLINGAEWINDNINLGVLYTSMRLSTDVRYDLNPGDRETLVKIYISKLLMIHMPSVTIEIAKAWTEEQILAVHNEGIRVYGRNWVDLSALQDMNSGDDQEIVNE